VSDDTIPRSAPAPQYPRIPATRPPAPAAEPARTAPRLVAVALLAGFIGALIGSGVMVLALRDDEPAAAPARDAVQAPTIEVVGGEDVDRVAAIAEAVLPTVVRVNIDGRDGLGESAGNGSGVIYRSDGYIITNNHVVAGADEIEVVFADSETAPAEVVGRDPWTDLAVLRVDRTGLPAIQLGDSSDLTVGGLAVAVGSPFGLEGSVTAGVISAVNRGPITVRSPDGTPVPLSNVIQTDAPINPGNSGGALVGSDGRLIGINSAILAASGQAANAGVGFAIPVNTAVDIAEELIAKGHVSHPFLGVEGTDLNRETAARLGVEEGAFVRAVEPGTPAAEAGLRAEDVIVAVGDEPITSMDDLIVAIRNREVGETVTITYIRSGDQRTAEVTLVERPR